MFLSALFVDLPATSRGSVSPGNGEQSLLLDVVRAAGLPDAVIPILLAPTNKPLLFQNCDGQHSLLCPALLLRKLYP